MFLEGELPLAGDGLLDVGDFFAGDAALGETDLDLGELFAGDAALGDGDLDLGDFVTEAGVLGEQVLLLADFLGDGVLVFAGLFTFRLTWSNSFRKPMTDARLRSECLGLRRDKLLRGVAPLRKGESGGNRLSNNSGLR